MEFLRLLQSIRFPAGNVIFQAVTACGGEVSVMVVMLILYWCGKKKHALYLTAVSFSAVLVNQLLKAICRVPRPWIRDASLSPVQSSLTDASGYSFPSGHAQNITAVCGSIGRIYRHTVVRTVCAVLVALVCFSRMYLGVHTPTDVLTGVAISLVLVMVLYPVFERRGDDLRVMLLVFGILSALALAALLFVELHTWPADMDADNFAETRRCMYMMFFCSLGVVISLPVEHRFIRFDASAPVWAQILKCALGLCCVMLIRLALKAPLLALFGGDEAPAAGVRYMLILLFAFLVWPLTFRWFSAGCPLGRK